MSSQSISAPRDANHVPALLATSSSDGSTPVVVYADPTSHRLLVQTSATSGSATAQTGTNNNVVQVTVGSADTTYMIAAALNCTAYTSGTLNVNVVYTDNHNTVTTTAIQGHFTSGYGTGVTGTGDFEGQVLTIRAKAASTVTITTSGTFALTYDIFGSIIPVH